LALDSESRWRLVRAMRAKGAQPASNETTIRDAKVDDLTQIVEIYNYYIRNSVVTFDLDAMKLDEWQHKFEWVQSLKLPFVVAESAGGQILGFAYVAPWRQKAAYRRTVEDSIYLRPAAIGKRVGTKLLTEIIERSKAAGVKEIVAVISDKGAESSIALHESFGFKHQGHLAKVGFKFGRWLGTVLMQKSL
jgi:L-amino acid N-acyltransferase YncA